MSLPRLQRFSLDSQALFRFNIAVIWATEYYKLPTETWPSKKPLQEEVERVYRTNVFGLLDVTRAVEEPFAWQFARKKQDNVQKHFIGGVALVTERRYPYES